MALILDVDIDAIRIANGLNNGDAIVELSNSVVGQNEGTQGTSGNRAVIATNEAPAGQAAASFNGANNSYDFGNIFAGITEGTLHALIKTAVDPAASDATSALWGSSGESLPTHYPYTDGNIYEGVLSTARKSGFNPTPNLSSDYRLYSVVSKPNEYTIYIDGAQVFTTAVNTVSTPASFLFGKAINFAYYLHGKLLRLQGYNNGQTGSDVTAKRDEWAAEYQLSNLGYSGGVNLTAAVGSFALTGGAASFNVTGGNVSLSAGAGAFALTGNAASFSVSAGALIAAAGSFALTGHAASFSVVTPDDTLLPNRAEFIGRFDLLGLSNGAAANTVLDRSGNGRHLTGTGWTFQTNVLNGKSVIRANGSQTPLTNSSSFTLSCGWVLAKYNGATFSNYAGLLSDLTTNGVLTGLNGGTTFGDFGYDLYEYRLNDRIYPADLPPAPMNVFRLIFFRFWVPIEMDGISLGMEKGSTATKWNGDVVLMGLYSRDFCESDIREASERIADYFALTLADVIPYQGMKADEKVYGLRDANYYDPPEGDRIIEFLGDAKRSFNLTFAGRRNAEFKEMRDYHESHYLSPACIYRDYDVIPPEDVEGYINSPLTKSGAINQIDYSFAFKEK